MKEKLLKIAEQIQSDSDRYMEPIKDLPMVEATLTPNYAIACSLKTVADAIKRELV